MKDMEQMIAAYNAEVEKAVKKVKYKLGFTVAAVAIGIASAGLGHILWASGSAVVSLVQFLTFDRKPVIQARDSAPAAMFHDVQKVLHGKGIKNLLGGFV
jgi:hypothetical protein